MLIACRNDVLTVPRVQSVRKLVLPKACRLPGPKPIRIRFQSLKPNPILHSGSENGQ